MMLENEGTPLSAAVESNIVGHLMPQYKVSHHRRFWREESNGNIGPTLFDCIIVII